MTSPLKYFDALVAILSDVEVFLVDTLQAVNLTRKATIQKEEILKKIRTLQEAYPQLSSHKSNAAQPPSIQVSEAWPESQEIYDSINHDDSDPLPTGAIKKKASFSGSEASTLSNAAQQGAAQLAAAQLQVSTTDVAEGSSMSGILVRKTLGKLDLRGIFKTVASVVAGKQYCVANGGVLYIFSNFSSKKQSEVILLQGYEARICSEQSSKKEISFELLCPGQRSHGFAASVEEAERWVRALNDEALKTPDFLRSSAAPDDDGSDYEEPTTPFSVSTPKVIAKVTAKASIKDSPKIIAKAVTRATSAPSKVSNVPTRGVKLRIPSVLDDDGEYYDDIDPVTPPGQPGREFYEDAVEGGSETADEYDDDLVYEAYDDIMAAKTAAGDVGPNPQPKLLNNRLVTSIRPPVSLPHTPTNPPHAARQGGVAASPISLKGEAEDYGNMYYGRWECRADAPNEISFGHGDVITVLSREYERFGWWVARFNGAVGLVPRDYLTPAYELVSG